MKSRGVQHDPLTDIANIRNTLKGYGAGFAIIKELVQNAEDAKASLIHIGWHPGFPAREKTHPLLQGPAICMVNDGPFEKKHEDAICRMGLGSKGADEQSIGRFGLGLKSVFHLCEAFFFIASHLETGANVRIIELFNPWHGRHHSEWDLDHPDTQTILNRALSGLLPNRPWFALWLPLRRRGMCNGVAPIVPDFPGDKKSPSSDIKHFLSEELDDVLPALRNLCEINYSVWENEHWKLQYGITTTSDSIRRKYPDKISEPWKMFGTIKTSCGVNDPGMLTRYTGRESLLADIFFEEIKKSDAWPNVVALREDGSVDAGKKEKALPHFSDYFMFRQKKNAKAKLRIKWAVFLPVGNDFYDEVMIPDFEYDITLLLHGYFFLNSERTNIDGLADNFRKSNGIYTNWNERLATHGNLDSILPALEQFVNRIGFSDSDVQLVTNALLESRIFRNFKDIICSNHQWIYKVFNNSAKWCCITGKEDVYPLPTPSPENDHFPYRVFPNLKFLAEQYHICFYFDALTNRNSMVSSHDFRKWSETMLGKLYGNLDSVFLNNQPAKRYLWKVIKLHSPLSINLWKCFEDIKLFKVRSIKTGFETTGSLNELIEHSNTHGLFSGCSDTVLEQSLQSVCVDLELKVLVTDDFDLRLFPSQLQETPRLDVRSCANTVLASKRLGTINSRISLIQYLLQNVQLNSFAEIYKKTARYLIHNDYSKINDPERLYLPSNEGPVAKTWNKVAEMALKVKGEQWRMIDQQFDQYLTQQFLAKCRIEKISVNIICDLLNSIEITKLNPEALDLDDRKNLLINLPDENLIKNLPIHEKIGGGFVSISELSYLEKKFHVTSDVGEYWSELLSRACVIRRFEDSVGQARQKDILPELDWHAAIELALTSPNPVRYAAVIMAGLSSIGTPRKEVGILLKETKWLPLNNGKTTSPQNVIHLEKAQEEIHRILNENDVGIYGILALEDWIFSHPALNALKQQFLNKKQSLEHLGSWLSQKDNMSLGLEKIDSPEELHEFAEIFSFPPNGVMPLYALLSNLTNDTELLQLSFKHLFPYIHSKVSAKRIITILKFLREKHQDSAIENKRRIFKWFNRFLKQAIINDCIKVIVNNIGLLNQLGKWKPTSKLVLPSEGIAKRHQLNEEQALILEDSYKKGNSKLHQEKKHFTQPIDTENPMGLKISAEQLINYLEDLGQTGVSREILGAVGATFGNYGPIKDWATNMLGGQSVERVRSEMIPTCIRPHEINRKHFVIKVIDEDTSFATSLTGEPFQVSISDNPESLLFGNELDIFRSVRNHPEVEGPNCHQIKLLNPKNFRDIPGEELLGILQKTVEIIIFNVYCNRVRNLYPGYPDIQEFWEKLSDTGQRSIKSVQLYLLNAGDFYIKQLGSKQHPFVWENLQKWERARQYRVDSELYTNQKEKLLQKAEKAERKAREDLKQLLISDDDVHQEFVNAFRQKMRIYQYDTSSIPFELFQNADDAYQELLNMGCDLESDHHQKSFIIRTEENRIQFSHWGRCINEYHRQGAFDQGKHLGFDRDLQKMLTLSYSDKGLSKLFDDISSNRDVTGKFGLGFKSVFFATSCPRILSGRLSFHVRGGFYPQKLERTSEDQLNDILNELRPGEQHKGTIFDLPLNNGDDKELDQVLSRFLKLVNFQLIFSKKIKKCEVHRPSQGIQTFSWQEKRVNGTESFFVGDLLSQEGAGYKSVLRMRSRNGDNNLKECSILFSLDVKGFTKFSDEIPSIWITSPTKEKNAVGFAVNGPFEPDVGRALLARDSETNKTLANDLSRSVGDLWVEFYDSSQKNWPDLVSSLRLAHNCSQKGFWESLWALMSNTKLLSLKNEPKGSSGDLLYTLTWGKSYGGYRKFIYACAVIPSKLWGDYNTLLSVADIEYAVNGLLDQKGIFERVSMWSSFREKVGIGKVVSEDKISSVLKKNASGDIHKIDKIRLIEAIIWDLNNKTEVSAQNARRFAQIIDKDFQYDRAALDHQEEFYELEDRFKKFNFETGIGKYILSKNIIVASAIPDYISEDEALRASFAPNSVVLSSKYDVEAIKFFVVCRGNMVAPVEKLTQWVLAAESENKRKSALLYLSQGELCDRVAKGLRQHGVKGSWLSELNSHSEYFLKWDDYDIDDLLLRKLSSDEALRKIRVPFGGTPVIHALVTDPTETLNSIYQWWTTNKREYIDRYETSIYPGGKQPNLKEDDFGKIDRSEWLTMLLLGAFHTLGRTQPEQHRSFITLCRTNGWWDTFSAEEPTEKPDKWMRVLDEYINEQVEDTRYEYWMNRFPTIYRFSRKLDDYAEAFYSLDQQGENVNVKKTLTPRTFEVFQGGGVDAAPIKKTLGMGACFVLREMIRSNLLKNRHILPYCYVPAEGVRNLLAKLKCKEMNSDESYLNLSRIIFEFLCDHLGKDKASFDGSFDIPLQYIARDHDLQKRFLK